MSVALNQNKGEGKPRRRLSNFRIKEVSLVDEAANGTEFLIAKSKSTSQKDAEIFDDKDKNKDKTDTTKKKSGGGGSSTTTTKEATGQSSTEKNVEPLTFAQLVLSTSNMKAKMDALHDQVKALKVAEDGQFTMGPEITGQCVSLLEEMSKMLFMFGSDSTLGFDEPAMMQKRVLKAIGLDEAEIEKVGRAMSGARLNRLKDSVKAFERGVKEMKALLQELESKKEDKMTEEEKKAKEADLKKKLAAEEAKLRKEMGLEEGAQGGDGGNSAAAAAASDANSGKGDSEEVAKLKAQIADLEKKLTGQSDSSKEVAELKKRLEALEAGGSNAAAAEETDVEKNKGGKTEDKPEYIEKNGRKVKKGLFKGLGGAKLSDVLAAQQGRKY